tara:strand:- start:1817 stop:2119 length:303 start_codon:yes stop_codon:yes gene_type:complete
METLLIKKDNHYFLERNNQMLLCPKQTRLLIPNQMANRLDLNQSACSSLCPLFQLKIYTDPDTNNDKFELNLCDFVDYTDIKCIEKASDLAPNTGNLLKL